MSQVEHHPASGVVLKAHIDGFLVLQRNNTRLGSQYRSVASNVGNLLESEDVMLASISGSNSYSFKILKKGSYGLETKELEASTSGGHFGRLGALDSEGIPLKLDLLLLDVLFVFVSLGVE